MIKNMLYRPWIRVGKEERRNNDSKINFNDSNRKASHLTNTELNFICAWPPVDWETNEHGEL
jgi:hypothetical protein